MQLLASVEDINNFLPPNVQISSSAPQFQVDAQRLIRAQLTAVFDPSVISSWATPDTTPELIRAVAGRLIAAKYYSSLVSQESGDAVPGYALNLYNEAIAILIDIRSGAQLVTDSDGNPITGNETDLDPSLDVFPNDDSPVFTMDRTFN